jgi:hypothetical protein
VIGADLCGVDLLPTPAGEDVVVELNAAVDVDHEDSLAGRDFYAAAAAALPLARRSPRAVTDRRCGPESVRPALVAKRRPPAR